MGGDRVGHLHGGFAVELRVVGEHASEHGDVGGRIRLAQQIVGLRGLEFLSGFLSGQRPVGKRQCIRSLVGRYEGKLLDEGGFPCVLPPDLPEHTGDAPCCFQGFVLGHSALDQVFMNVLAELLRALRKMPIELRFEDVGPAPGPLQALRRDPQARRTTEDDALRPAGVVPVQVGGAIGGQQMQLQEISHGTGSCRSGFGRSGCRARYVPGRSQAVGNTVVVENPALFHPVAPIQDG